MPSDIDQLTALTQVLKTYWGYDGFLPLQAESMGCVMGGHDSLTVLPTGGGKSLCYQAPAVCGNGLVIVVSPLVALMKDQVDALRECGIAAEAIHSNVSADNKRRIANSITKRETKLLYVAPETLLKPTTLDFLAKQELNFFAIDEAHCISAWGHDFRPEYRELSVLRQRFPSTPIHAFTATANPHVRTEITEALAMRNPRVLVGEFFRSNLFYHVVRKSNPINQIVSVLERHANESGLIYCISRDETESLAAEIQKLGYTCVAYHAGLPDAERTRRQEAFINDEVQIVVATIAFGMGIDKSDVRFVIHAGMPKSLANYQQESGRAGRDGLESECWLLYSPGDMMVWRRIIENSPAANRGTSEKTLDDIHAFCVSTKCRHQGLTEHFGQAWTRERCDACDVCLGRFEQIADPLTVGQKILSCVLRVKENFGAGYIAKVLAGSQAAEITNRHHNQLSTYGLLKEFRPADIRDWIEQLLAQGFLQRVGEYNVLRLTDTGRELLRGNVTPTLSRTAEQKKKATRLSVVDSWEAVDKALFEKLRVWRRQTAIERAVPSYVICGDVTLRDLARRRPIDVSELLNVHGIGNKKAEDFGEPIIDLIKQHCEENGVPANQTPLVAPRVDPANSTARAAFELFDQGLSIDEVARKLDRALSTVSEYLNAYIQDRKITDPVPWLTAEDFEAIRSVVQHVGRERLKPIHEALQGRIGYPQIRLALVILKNQNLEIISDA
jgi:ATP-dependent DNA helicase RecQ